MAEDSEDRHLDYARIGVNARVTTGSPQRLFLRQRVRLE